MEKFHSQSNKFREVNDQLSSILQNYDDLRPPNIVVVGEQSAGKSSVLEYLSGVRFVTGQDMVTRCPLQLRMTYSNTDSSVAIVKSAKIEPVEIPDPQTEEGAKLLEAQIKSITDVHIGEGTVSNELIEVHVISPHVPDLTLVDLPGLITKSSKNNPTLADDIRVLVKKNMTEKDCILIVGDAGRDLQTIVGFTEAEEKDKEQKRTLCVLTKVDKCIHDKELREKLTKSLQNNGAIQLLHGFIALKNRTSDEKHKSIEECEDIEMKLLSDLDVPLSNKGRSALIEKLTEIQNEHLEESIPKQKELLNEEFKKVEDLIQKTSKNIRDYQSQGEEALIRLYEVSTSQLISTYKDFSENKENLKATSKKDLLDTVKSNPLSLSVFTSLIDSLSKKLSDRMDISEDVGTYYQIVTEFIERGKGYPGLPDLYQPTILRDLVCLELLCMKEIVDNMVSKVLMAIKEVLLDNLVSECVKSLGVSGIKLEKMLRSELKKLLESSFEKSKNEIEQLFRRESQRTVTLNESYAFKTNLMNQLYKAKKSSLETQKLYHNQPSSQEEKKLEDRFKKAGLSKETGFITSLSQIDVKDVLKHTATIEILIKFKSYIGIVCSRLVDNISQILYDNLVVTTAEKMVDWLKVKRENTSFASKRNHNQSSSETSVHNELPGIPFNRIVDIMKPSKAEIMVLEKLMQKREAIKKAIEIIERLDWE